MPDRSSRGRAERDSRRADDGGMTTRDVLEDFQSYAETWGDRVAGDLSPEQSKDMVAKMDDLLRNTPFECLPEPLREMFQALGMNSGTRDVSAIRERLVAATQAAFGGDLPHFDMKYNYTRLDLKGEAWATSDPVDPFPDVRDIGLVYYKDGSREWNMTFKFWECEDHEIGYCEKCGNNALNAKKFNQLMTDLVKDRCLIRGKATWVDAYIPEFMAWSVQIMTDRAFGQNDKLCKELAAIVPAGTNLAVVKSIAMLIEVTSFIFDPDDNHDDPDSAYCMFTRHLVTCQKQNGRPGYKVMTLDLFRQVFENFDERHIFRMPDMVVAMFEMEVPIYVPPPGHSAIGTLLPFITHYFNVPPGQPEFEKALSDAIGDAEQIVIPLKHASIPTQEPAALTNAQAPPAKQEPAKIKVFVQFYEFSVSFLMTDVALLERLWIALRKKLIEAGEIEEENDHDEFALVPALDCPNMRNVWGEDNCSFPHYIPLQSSLSAFDLSAQKSEVRLALVWQEYVDIGIFVHGPGARTKDYFIIRPCIDSTFREIFDQYWEDFKDEFDMLDGINDYGLEFLRDGTPNESMMNQRHGSSTTPTPWLSKMKFKTAARRRLLPNPGTVFELGRTLYSYNLLHGVHIGLRKL